MSELADAVQRSVAVRVRAVRTERGLTQRVLAERAGCSRSSLANVEAARQNLSLRRLCDLAEALGIAVEDLLAPPQAG